ncbi:N-acetylmuramoyl-L-alanine amidase family protein [Fodinicurvata sediminis]|uniref:N-acetylmuramoyl-L-alanine amidase family protein n=1 Tax=Fodinicurvata sediminis TaxID=1121832 RepID=UPI0003B375EC|nr:N-acetylmuramoyl-L-alanine amidase [Fodinicurvata sediminis]
MYRRTFFTGLLASTLLGSLSARLAQAEVPPLVPAKPEGAVIVLDPGHGGRDPGAIGGAGTLEKNVTLAICQELRSYLNGRLPHHVALTRESDESLALPDRVQIGHELQADLFISIHADAAPNRNARGLSAYTLAENASDDFAESLAERENAVDEIYGIDLRNTDSRTAAILMDLARRIAREDSRRAQRLIVEGASEDLHLLENPRRSANFAVLRSGEVPSVLLETGFLTNPQDEQLLADPAARRRIAWTLGREIGQVAGLFLRERNGSY